jgi:hypothetical protein
MCAHLLTLKQFQLRLPSMTIRRDNMASQYPSVHLGASKSSPATIQTESLSTPANPSAYTVPNANLNPSSISISSNAMGGFKQQRPSATVVYALNPLQQNAALQKEEFEKERKALLKKASNFGGESAERIISDYLAI